MSPSEMTGSLFLRDRHPRYAILNIAWRYWKDRQCASCAQDSSRYLICMIQILLLVHLQPYQKTGRQYLDIIHARFWTTQTGIWPDDWFHFCCYDLTSIDLQHLAQILTA